MNIKVLGIGCGACRSMFSDVERAVARLELDARVESITNVEKIISYGVMSSPVLIIDEQVVMIGYHGAKKIEAALQQAADKTK